jgi:colicin import membrane protein
MSEPKPAGQMVQAVVIDPQLVRQQALQIRQQREAAGKKEQARLDKLRRESDRLEKNRKAEEENIRKLKEKQVQEAKAMREAEKHRVEKEKQRKAEEARLKIAQQKAAKAAADRKLQEAAAAKAEQQRVAKEKAAKKAVEKARKEKEAAERAEKQRIAKEKDAAVAAEKARKAKQAAARAEKERKQQEAALNDIFAGLETESTQNSSAKQQFISNEAQRFGAIYTQLIQQNLRLEDSYRGRSCRVNLKLIPTGTNAILGSLSILDGDSRLCAATKRAVAQVQSYPLPKDPDIVKSLKNINLTVSPE